MSERREATRRAVEWVVDHIRSEDDRCLCLTTEVGPDGMRVTRLTGQTWGASRHVWLQFQLPGDAEAIRALGEVRHEEVTASGAAVRGYRFKYIFPRSRRRLEAYLSCA